MSRFYADITGGRGTATRQGHAASGIRGHVRGWNSGVSVWGRDDDGRDVFDIYATTGSSGVGGTTFVGSVLTDDDGRAVFVPHPVQPDPRR